MAELVLRLRVAGNADVEAAMRSLQSEAKEVEATLEPLNRQNMRLGDSSRTSMRAMGDLAQTLSGTASVLRMAGVENKALDASMGAVITSMSLASTATNLYKNALQLAQGATKLLAAGTITLTGALGPLAIAVGLVSAAVWLFTQRTDESRRALAEYEGAVNVVGLAVRNAARDFETLNAKMGRTAAERERVTQWSEAVEVGTRHAIQAIEEGWRKREAAQQKALADAKQAAEKAAAAREREFKDQAQQIVDFNIWQRQEWEKAAEARTRATISAIDKIIEAEERLKEETVDLVQRANQAAINAIEERMEEQRRAVEQMLEEERRLSDETEDLVRRANQAVVDSIEDQMEAQRRAALATKPLWVQQAENAKKAAQDIAESLHGAITNALMDALETATDIFDAIGKVAKSVFNEIARLLISFGVRSFLKWIGLPFAKGGVVQGGLVPAFAGMQHGGRVDRPTLAFMGEGGQSEAVVPLPDNRSIPVKFTGDRGADREVALRIIVQNVWGDPSQVKTSPDEIKAVVVNDIQNRGQIMKAIRIVIP